MVKYICKNKGLADTERMTKMAKTKRKAAKKIKGWNPIVRNLVVLVATVFITALLGVLAVFGSKIVNLVIGSDAFRPFTWTIVSVVCAIVFGVVEMAILGSTSKRKVNNNNVNNNVNNNESTNGNSTTT